MNDASDELVGWQGRGDPSARVDRLQRIAIEKPPRHAVEHRQDQSVGPDHRPGQPGDLRQGGRLDGDDQQLLRTEGVGIVRGAELGQF